MLAIAANLEKAIPGAPQKRSFSSAANMAAVSAFLLSLGISSAAVANDPPETAAAIMTDMPVRERTAYISGVVEGLAYGRFRKDTLAGGAKDESGMNCVLRWFYKDAIGTMMRIEATFNKYPSEYPPLLLNLMIKKECGE